MREVVLDTETTGLNPKEDRLIEIGCVELVNYIPTGRSFHTYINPMRKVNPGAVKVHGLTDSFLEDKPLFHEVASEFIEFIGFDPIVAHNADFDVAFLNEALDLCFLPPLPNQVVNTLALARQVKKGGLHNLDALCKHYGIDTAKRTKHGALIDSEILAEVYLHLRGGRQFGLGLPAAEKKAADCVAPEYPPRPHISKITDAERDAHAAFIAELKNSVWSTYLAGEKNLDEGRIAA
jgi:DNA polymerase-3 subunit epsilon